jgi:hypothetical protein
VIHSNLKHEQWGAPCGCTDNYQEKEPELRRDGDGYDDDDDNDDNNKQGCRVKKSLNKAINFLCEQRKARLNSDGQVNSASGISTVNLLTVCKQWNVKMLKQSRNRPGVAQRVPGRLGSQIS